MKKNTIKIRMPGKLHAQMLEDLKRPHSFAYERVGFLYATTSVLPDGTRLVLCNNYHAVADEDYIEDDSVGAKIGSAAIRGAMQKINDGRCGGFHVHLHDHSGLTSPSGTDKEGLPPVVQSLANIGKTEVNGMLILSRDSFYAMVKIDGIAHMVLPDSIVATGYPMTMAFNFTKLFIKSKIFDRQSFLGKNATLLFENIRVGLVGLGGGGSHVAQQLAHLGVVHFTLFDYDHVEDTNHNRLIGSYFTDIASASAKTKVAKRLIKKINPRAQVQIVNSRWEEKPEELQVCDIVMGGVDTYQDRGQLEAECRRYLIPYLDIGMDIYKDPGGSYQLSGQLILSAPEGPCLRCMGFITEAKSAAKYGATGGRPQVIWPNGLLASSAIGIFVDLVTGWSKIPDRLVYMAYDGNTGLISNHIRLSFTPETCEHYSLSQLGKPKFIKL
jgi:hypothetical protein